MRNSGPGTNSGKVDLNELKQAGAPTPEKLFLDQANNLLEARFSQVRTRVLNEMRATDYQPIKNIAQHADATLTIFQKGENISRAAETRATVEITAQAPLFTNIEAEFRRHGVAIADPADPTTGLNPTAIQRFLEEKLAHKIREAIQDAMLTSYNEALHIEDRRAEQALRDQQAQATRDAATREQARLAAEHAHQQEQIRLAQEAATRETARLAAEQAYRDEQARLAREAAAEKAAERAANDPLTRLTPEQRAEYDQQQRQDGLRREYFSEQIENGKDLSINEWINNCGLDSPSPLRPAEAGLFQADRKELGRSGVYKDPNYPEDHKYYVSPSHFRNLRIGMLVGWGVTVGVLTVTTMTFGPVSLWAWAPVVGGVNWAYQKFLSTRHNQKLSDMYNKIKSEMEDAGPMESGIAWAGVMHTFLRDYKPPMLFPNWTKLNLFSWPEANTVDALLKQLRQAAAYGASAIEIREKEPQKQTLFKDAKFNDYLAQTKRGRRDLLDRWTFFTDASSTLAFPLKAPEKLELEK